MIISFSKGQGVTSPTDHMPLLDQSCHVLQRRTIEDVEKQEGVMCPSRQHWSQYEGKYLRDFIAQGYGRPTDTLFVASSYTGLSNHSCSRYHSD